MQIELLVVPNCPHETAAADLIATAVADTGVRATVTRTVIADEDAARERGFNGSPTILLDGSDPFATPNAAVGVTMQALPHTGRAPRGAGAARPASSAYTGSRCGLINALGVAGLVNVGQPINTARRPEGQGSEPGTPVVDRTALTGVRPSTTRLCVLEGRHGGAKPNPRWERDQRGILTWSRRAASDVLHVDDSVPQ